MFAKLRASAPKLALSSAALLALVAPFAAHAVDDPFTAAITTATTSVGTYGAALVALSAVGVVFMIALKYVKRIPRAS